MNLSNLPRGSLFALLLIIAGSLLFLENLGLVPLGDIRAYWPLWLVVWGVFIMDKTRSSIGSVWAGALIISGILLILGNLQIIRVNGGIVWPVMLIAFGVTMLMRPAQFGEWQGQIRLAALERRKARRARFQGAFGNRSFGNSDEFHGNQLHEAVIFSSVSRRVDTQQFEGGTLGAVFGSIEIDLTSASITSPQRMACLKASAVFGGIEILVPRTWKVDMKSAAVFGGCEDRTLPPRPEAGFEPVTLVVTGGAVFGGIQIRN
jgi:predicted membrane protein